MASTAPSHSAFLDTAIRSITHLGVSAGSLLLKGSRRRARESRRGRDQASTALELLAKRAAWDRYCEALDALFMQRAAFESSPSDLTAEQVVQAEVEVEDAMAMAGEFEVCNLPWGLA